MASNETYVAIEKRIDKAEGGGILARWECGRELLKERVGEQLPRGRLDEVAKAIGKSRTEILYRMLFAKRYNTKRKVINAIDYFRSWYAIVESFSSQPHISQNSGEHEWYTPPEYIEAARRVMGEIDLDPASSRVAQEYIQAGTYYTKKDNGLSKEWSGRVWLNPPYASDIVDAFVEKLVESLPNVSDAILLTNNATDTQWWQLASSHASAVCFTEGRIRYLDEAGKPSNAPLQGQSFLYFGSDVEGFLREFQGFGKAWTIE